jgi:hypothetical protein
VELQETEDERSGHLVVDSDGFIREASFLDGRSTLRLEDLVAGPLDDASPLFSIDS